MKQPIALRRRIEIQTSSPLLTRICVHHVASPASAYAGHRYSLAIAKPEVTVQDASGSFVGRCRRFIDDRPN